MRTTALLGLFGLSLAAVSGLAITGSATAMAPARPASKVPSGKAPRTAPGPCAKPGKTTCLTKGYLETACGIELAQDCKAFVLAGLESNPARASAPTVKMLRPDKTEIPADLRTGAKYRYTGPKPGRQLSIDAAHALGKSPLKGPPPKIGVSAEDAAKFHRTPAWDANGEKITSCAEYGYEKLYDWSRFVDATAACKGDQGCQVDVAFLPTTPGIARRKLRRKDGKELVPQPYFARTKTFTKNDFFSFGTRLVYAGGPKGVEKTAELEALEAALAKGKLYYQLGCTSGCKSTQFKDEWAFHEQMRVRTKTTSQAELDEYERRKAKLRELVALYDAAVREELSVIDKLPIEAGLELPFDVLMVDPFTRYDKMQQMDDVARSGAARALKKLSPAVIQKMPSAGVDALPIPQAGGAQGAMAPHRSMATSVLAAPVAKPGAMPGGTPTLVVKCTKASFEAAGVPIHEVVGSGPISCRIGQLLREEWARKGKGQKSCLDLGNDECDWSPAIFHARFIDKPTYLDQQQRAELDCAQWTGGTLTNKNNLKAVEDYIKEMKAAVTAEIVKLAPYKMAPGPVGKKFGDTLAESEYEGDKDWFAGGYDYTLGWSVEPLEKTQAGNVCRLAGNLTAAAGVDAWVLGGEVSVVDALAKADVNAKHPQTKKWSTHVVSHLRILGIQLFTPVDEYYAQAWTESFSKLGVKVPNPAPSFTVWIGPVPVTGAGWGELMYGADFKLEGVLESPTCSANDITFGARSNFTPWLRVDGRAQVGIGISGLVSAGVRAKLNLITLGIPVDVSLLTKMKSVAQEVQASLAFDATMSLTLGTLAGSMSLYLEFLMFTEEFELFAWNGIGPATIPLIPPLKAELALVGMK